VEGCELILGDTDTCFTFAEATPWTAYHASSTNELRDSQHDTVDSRSLKNRANDEDYNSDNDRVLPRDLGGHPALVQSSQDGTKLDHSRGKPFQNSALDAC
jgi:hypothetical protein